MEYRLVKSAVVAMWSWMTKQISMVVWTVLLFGESEEVE